MGDMDPKNWPVRSKSTAVGMAAWAAGRAADRVAKIVLRETGNSDADVVSYGWPHGYETNNLIDTDGFARFLLLSPGCAGDALFRWAGANGFHMLGADTFEAQPPSVRLPYGTYAAAFHSVLNVMIDELCAYEARRTAAIMAPLQRTPIRDTIFETSEDDGPFHDLGPRGSFTPPVPRGQAEAQALSVAASAESSFVASAATPAAALAANPLTHSPAGDADQAGDAPSPEPTLGVSSLTGAPAVDQLPAPISSAKGKRKG